METISGEFIFSGIDKFKSYYVVWKRHSNQLPCREEIGLNRTM